jgi:metal-dependent amidase/aminoacylase/carboxypeptidase family protein
VPFTDDERAALIALRRELHRFPELSWRETETARRIEHALRRLGVSDVEHVADTGLIARIPGTRGGAQTAVRGDIDALPI